MSPETYALTLSIDSKKGRSWGCAHLEQDGWRALDPANLDPFVARGPCRIGVAVAASPREGPVSLSAVELTPVAGGERLRLAPPGDTSRGEGGWAQGFRTASGRGGRIEELGIYGCETPGEHRVRVALVFGPGQDEGRPVPVMGPP